MTHTHRTLIKVLGLANVLVYAAAALLLWYIWPALVETPDPVASADQAAIPIAVPTGLLSAQVPVEATEQGGPAPMMAATSEESVIESVPAPLQAPEPTATPYTLVWPEKAAGGKTLTGVDAPAAAQTIAVSPETVNIVLMGCDYRAGQAHWRTDTIIVLSVNPQEMKISMLSIPRDLWVYIPDYGGSERINTADFLGERIGVNNDRAAELKKVIQMNLGIPINYFVRVNYDAFEKIMSTIGGVTVEVACPLEDIFPDKKSPTGWSRISIKPGIHHMDGHTALVYARTRDTTNDFSRSRRQHEIMKGVWQGALAADIIRDGPRLWNILRASVQTDLGLQDMLALGYVGMRVRPENIHSYFIDYASVQSWTTPAGAAVLLPVQSKIQGMVQAMFAPEMAKAPVSQVAAKPVESRAARVTLLDGIGNPERANLAASQLRWKGLKVVGVAAADRKDHTQTIIVDYGTNSQPQNLTQLCNALGVKPEAVQKAPDPGSPVDFQVTIGRDYDPCQAGSS
jgi:polyisoprenyl-teichoic acid--peptidoglycan teichoic acid transferase